jgi:hypothetical protein
MICRASSTDHWSNPFLGNSVAETNVGKWNDWYANYSRSPEGVRLYGDPTTYLLAAAFSADAEEVEDWGCGLGGFRQYCLTKYRGLDGSRTPFADQIVDLCEHRSTAPAILLRHVLEHNHDWLKVLKSAVASFQRKLCIIIFTPFTETTKVIAENKMLGGSVPDISFYRADIERELVGLQWRLMHGLRTQSQYGCEHVYFVWR